MKNTYIFLDENTIEVKATQNQAFIIDVDDLPLVASYSSWQADFNKTGNSYYIRHTLREKGKKKKTLKLHRVIAGIIDVNIHVDHIDGNTLNNRRSNLRSCTRNGNNQNRGKGKYSTTGHKNIHWSKLNQNYVLYITTNSVRKTYGTFVDINDAIAKRNELLLILHGEFANITD